MRRNKKAVLSVLAILVMVSIISCPAELEIVFQGDPVSITDITLPAALEVFELNEELLTVTTTPYDATNTMFKWNVEDPSIAAINVSNEFLNKRIIRVTGVSEGETKVTVTSQDGNITKECIITVKPLGIDSITINQNDMTLWPDQKYSLTAVVLPANLPNKTHTWVSSNPEIVEIDEATGVITAITGGGPVTITVTTNVTDGVTGLPATDTINISVINAITLFDWSPEKDDNFVNIGIEHDGVFSQQAPVAGYRTFNGIYMQNFVFNANGNAFTPGTPAPVRAVKNGDTINETFHVTRDGYYLLENTTPCLQIGSTARARTTSSALPPNNLPDDGQFDLSNTRFRVVVEWTVVQHSPTNQDNGGQLILGTIYNAGGANAADSPWPGTAADGGGSVAINMNQYDVGQVIKTEMIKDSRGKSALITNSLAKGFITVRSGVDRSQIIVYSVILQKEIYD